jgi:hypothetical protein
MASRTYAAAKVFNSRKKPVLLFVMALAITFIIAFLMQLVIYGLLPKLGIFMISLKTGNLAPGFYGGFAINYVGFIVPLVVSIALLTSLSLKRRSKLGKLDAFFIVAIVIVLALSIPTRPIESVGLGSGMDVPLLLVVVLWLTALIIKRNYTAGLPLSYTMIFFTAAASDMLAIGRFKGGVTFGGFGILDGDFLLPLATLLSMYLAMRIDGVGQKHRKAQLR